MIASNRRTFLGSLGGVLAFGLGGVAGGRTGGRIGLLERRLDTLDLGRFEALAALLQETGPRDLQTILIAKLRAGLPLEDLVAAGALANARSFGGHDYDGYHCFMALMPAWEMSKELEGEERWLPVLKVIHRTARRIQDTGGRDDALGALGALGEERTQDASQARKDLWQSYLARDIAGAERAFHRGAGAKEALDDVQSILRETLDVHRVVLTWRSWDALQLTGEEHAETLLRQPIRWFIDREESRVARGLPTPPLRTLLPALMEDHDLTRAARGTRRASDDELDELCKVVFSCEQEDAARAVVEALAGGLAHEDVGEALSLAANKLLLHDPGRREAEGRDKPKGSVHGASVGIHASDAARAWRNLAAVSGDADSAANLIAGAYHTAGRSRWVASEPYAYARHVPELERFEPGQLLLDLATAVSERDQERAGAFAACYGSRGLDPAPLFAKLHAAALEADGALHAEKYYRTVREDHAASRPRHRGNHLIALARVCASQAGFEAPGLAEARAALKG